MILLHILRVRINCLHFMSKNKTNYHLQKLVAKLKEYEYTVRFEKGNFRTGYCILEDRKVIVVNKFHDVDIRIDNLRQILATIRQAA